MKYFISLLSIFFAFVGYAQHRWQQQSPTQAYWQQHVHYTIDATVNHEDNTISGNEQLVYTNHSPDTLNELYFHLYQNAFQPNSHLHELHKANKNKPVFGAYETEGKGTEIMSVTIDGTQPEFSIDNTIMNISLAKPLRPNTSITINIDFKTYFDRGSIGRRMTYYTSYGYKHYNGVHWYPRISVYDRKFGWTTDQHLGREFYGDFGEFDVNLTFSNHFIVEATGQLINENEVLPTELKAKLDIKNFKDKPWNSAPSVVIKKENGLQKVWKYHAENVHDFAFTADPTYRIGEAEWNGIKCIALVSEPHAAKWQNAAEYTAKIIKTFSEDFGMYEYPKMVVADARDGMEYPMLTLDGGWDPNYRELLVHEVAHNWFFGMVGNNETYRAPLDEGFTQFLTAWGLRKIDGDTLVKSPENNWYTSTFRKPETVNESQVYYGYMRDAVKHNDPSLNTHSDDFNSALGQGGGYGHVYYKTAVMLFQLEYVLGEALFQKAMKNYVDEWKFAHPYVEDFRNSIINYTHVDLNWFFDQWWEQPKHIDYAIKHLRFNKKDQQWELKLKRNGSMQMPVDFTVTTEDNEQHQFLIPNTVFKKQTSATVLPKWFGWGKLNKTYIAKFKTDSKSIIDVQLNKGNELADINPINNGLRPKVTFNFDSRIYNRPDIHNYEIKGRPDVWFNGYDGIKTGVYFKGSYLNFKHVVEGNVWFNTGQFQSLPENRSNLKYDNLSFRFKYSTGLPQLNKGASVFAGIKSLDGLNAYKFGFKQQFANKQTYLKVSFNSLFRKTIDDLNYLIYPTQWLAGMRNNFSEIELKHRYRVIKGSGNLAFKLRNAGFGSDYNYGLLAVEETHKQHVAKLTFRGRLFAQYGTGNMPLESALFLAGANPEQMMENKYTRSMGFIPNNHTGMSANFGNFQQGGGLNVRGMNGYLLTLENRKNELVSAFSSQTGAAASIEIDFNKYIPLKLNSLKPWFALSTYAFSDVAVIDLYPNSDRINFSTPIANAGLGTQLTWHNFGLFEDVNPLNIRFDFPFWVSEVPTGEDNFKFRWLVGINRTF